MSPVYTRRPEPLRFLCLHGSRGERESRPRCVGRAGHGRDRYGVLPRGPVERGSASPKPLIRKRFSEGSDPHGCRPRRRLARRLACDYRNWLSLLPRRLNDEAVGRRSSADWHGTQVRAPGSARRRASGISSPHRAQWVSPSPASILARASRTASVTVSSICSCTAPSRVQPPAIELPSLSRSPDMEISSNNRIPTTKERRGPGRRCLPGFLFSTKPWVLPCAAAPARARRPRRGRSIPRRRSPFARWPHPAIRP
jgi:hypothetical protein